MNAGSSYVFSGGGTGGHLFPGIAVADALRRIDPAADITFLTTNRPIDAQLLSQRDYRQVPQSVQPLPAWSRPWRWLGFLSAWRASCAAARRILTELNPHAVLGLGGYAAAPAVVEARRMGIRTAILNPDAIPGAANRRLARYADLVVMQWHDSAPHFRAGTNCRALGCPVRRDFAAVEQRAAREHFELSVERPVLLVTGASQGARTINRAVTHVASEFLRRNPDWQILHLSGQADEGEVRAAYEAADVRRATVLAFTHEMNHALCAADVVVSRAGASTLAELTLLGRASILLPYPYHRDRHQHANGQVLVDAGAAAMLEDRIAPEQNAGPLLEALLRLADPDVRRGMSAAAGRLARPDAADAVARWLADN
ncbi:MAG: UDP-N-acetylglucosamine--N-acetylmuramyl-(pentapeptide) pyrophosphoryl-undecaprenol N-acetylglucosamine transferase [Phycisphaerae bacterium]|nr:UDP-N-acetylglucosamine--N-acetylmuramyl-(pentapeptide) pyrophosphoryl-undecaprenol N-acetylglucosamine transferase [Phycisphaerae bacterium]